MSTQNWFENEQWEADNIDVLFFIHCVVTSVFLHTLGVAGPAWFWLAPVFATLGGYAYNELFGSGSVESMKRVSCERIGGLLGIAVGAVGFALLYAYTDITLAAPVAHQLRVTVVHAITGFRIDCLFEAVTMIPILLVIAWRRRHRLIGN